MTRRLPTLRFPGRRRRPTAALAALVAAGVVVAVVAMAGLGTWCIRRRGHAGKGDGITQEQASFDQAALERAAGEGMVVEPHPRDEQPAPGSLDAFHGSNGVVREVSGTR